MSKPTKGEMLRVFDITKKLVLDQGPIALKSEETLDAIRALIEQYGPPAIGTKGYHDVDEFYKDDGEEK